MLFNKQGYQCLYSLVTKIHVNTRLFSTVILILFLSSFNSAQALEPQQEQQIKKVVHALKTDNREALSRMVSYPLLRQAPLAPINDPQALLERYDQVFDSQLLQMLTRTNANTEWVSIGWRGVIFSNGLIALDPEGNITEVGYQSRQEAALIRRIQPTVAAKGRRALHRSVTKFNQPIVNLTTPRFHIRVDDLGNGRLRYASWPRSKRISESPDLVLGNGHVINSNGRNQHYVFNNGSYSYQLNINRTTDNAQAKGRLDVFKAGQPWFSEVATKVSIEQ